jgi:hypothetical protein
MLNHSANERIRLPASSFSTICPMQPVAPPESSHREIGVDHEIDLSRDTTRAHPESILGPSAHTRERNLRGVSLHRLGSLQNPLSSRGCGGASFPLLNSALCSCSQKEGFETTARFLRFRYAPV